MAELKQETKYRLSIWEVCVDLPVFYLEKRDTSHLFGFRNAKGLAKIACVEDGEINIIDNANSLVAKNAVVKFLPALGYTDEKFRRVGI